MAEDEDTYFDEYNDYEVNEDITVIPSSGVPDSIEFYKNYREHSKKKRLIRV